MNQPVINVGYAEDHHAVRKGIVSLIEESGDIKVTLEGSDGKDLLDKLSLCEQLPDVLLMDLNMPVMNGFDLLKEIRKRWPNIPALVLTSFYQEYYIMQMIRLGARGYLLKSTDPEHIIDGIRKVYEYGYYYNESLSGKMVSGLVAEKFKAPVLNEREIELLRHVCSDYSYADIARLMQTTYKTVDGIRMRLCTKLQINSRIGLVLAAIRFGYYTVESEKFISFKSGL
jgi:two-component system, NarL family, invasion response regulator UvrY